jgi:hypothetical protein
VRQVTVVVVAVILLASADALRPFALGEPVSRAHSYVFGFAENSNQLAYVSVFAAGLIWFFRTHAASARWRPFTGPAVWGLVLTAFLAGSRNGLLQLVLLGIFVLNEHRTLSASRKLYGLLLAGTMIFVIVAVVVPSTQWLRATNFDTTISSPGGKSTHARLTGVKVAAEVLLENPVFGVGPGNFRWHYQSRYGEDLSTHNSYLWALTTAGPLFLALYLLLFRSLYRRLRTIETTGPSDVAWLGKALRVNLILFMAYSAFADHWLSVFFYLFVGMTVALTRLAAPPPAPGRAAPSWVWARPLGSR